MKSLATLLILYLGIVSNLHAENSPGDSFSLPLGSVIKVLEQKLEELELKMAYEEIDNHIIRPCIRYSLDLVNGGRLHLSEEETEQIIITAHLHNNTAWTLFKIDVYNELKRQSLADIKMEYYDYILGQCTQKAAEKINSS